MNRNQTGWPAGSSVSTGPYGWPSNLLPPVIYGWPRGSAKAATDADALLASAVGYWDATKFREGDRFLRNQGVAGSLLDLRLGSSELVNSNEPLWLGPSGDGYCYLSGASGNYLSVPDAAALDITGDLDMWVDCALDSWTPAADQMLLGKFTAAGNQRSYGLIVPAGFNTIQLVYSTDGISLATLAGSTVNTGLQAGERKRVRVTRNATTGVVKYYTADPGGAWTQLGADVAGSTGSLFSGSATVNIGANNDGTGRVTAGKFYRAQVLNGIAGTVVLDVNMDAITSSAQTTFTEQSSNAATVTINSATSGRKTVVVPSAAKGGMARFLFGTDDYAECLNVWQHQLLNFGQGDSFTALAVVRQKATPVSSGRYLSKLAAADTTGSPGWAVRTPGTGVQVDGHLQDSLNVAGHTGPTFTAGANTVIGMVVDRPSRTINTFARTTLGTPASIDGYGSAVNPHPFRIGARSDTLAALQDFEFTAAAVWRQALTPAQLALIANKNWGA